MSHAELPPLSVGILVGGQSVRMHRAKALLPWGEGVLLERTVQVARSVSSRVVLLGACDVPDSLAYVEQLPDAPDAGGPLAGIAAAFRSAPDHRWIILPCDLPLLHAGALSLLLDAWRPDRWVVQVKRPDQRYPEPLGALYGPPMGPLFEQALGEARQAPWYAIRRAQRHIIDVDEVMGMAWMGVNTPEQWAKAQRILSLPA
ncbi:molybdenum cofactor guanylyltransferase [bacterium]|nr:molybdenum cofactor guanylyltransferase [bacterium]